MSIKSISDNEFKASINNGGVTVIEFGAPWCAPCKNLLPILDDLDREFGGNVSIYKMNVDDSPAVSSEFEIMSMPTVMVFKSGQPQEKLVGLRPKQAYQSMITKWLA